MAAMTPLQRQQRSCLFFLFFLIIVLVVVGGIAFAGLSLYTGKINLGNILGVNTTSTPTLPISGIGVMQAPDSEYIGISDGTYAFDINRSDGKLKQQAAASLKAGDITGALSLWHQAIVQAPDSSNDAEVLIYLEDQRILASHKPYITLVVGTTLTGSVSNISAGRDDLQGAYVAQKEYNDGEKLNGGVQVRLLIANSGSQATYATTVAQQIVQAAKKDHSIVGVMGWPFDLQSLNVVSILSEAHIPMVSQTASGDELTGISSYFFRVAPSNKVQAIAGAKYAEKQLHVSRAALFVDPADAYSQSLANDFSQQFTSDGNQIVATEKYTIGQTATLPSLLQNALNADPQMIYFSGYSDDMAHIPQVQLEG